jgi:hypothetical protein
MAMIFAYVARLDRSWLIKFRGRNFFKEGRM